MRLFVDCFYRLPIPIILGSECLSAIHGWLLLEPRFTSKPATHSQLLLLSPLFII
ncbi:hypothetical protein QJS10_CPA07g00974 [Acorus calamus]|uniref:Uncharacterized protein n=1 Tax=Acorus calamus TaxID=4465 RepID=A0AAV9EDY2_ACOCL|nr:hypothetical protein QJS10_CPA07g00974 [Acorus calamus]